MTSDDVKLIAFYLPQFHRTPENDCFWGPGYTEWTCVSRARPRFRGHYQPHLPGEMGFYDLRVPETRREQAALAQAHGIHGFAYYHYWFHGKRMLWRPFQDVMDSGEPDMPFCLVWANEPWTRRWDGHEQDIIVPQTYSAEDDRAHIRHLMPSLADPRCIRVGGRPLFLVYRTDHLPDPARTADIWREEALRAGVGEIYLARVESFCSGVAPASIGFDAAVEFAPDWRFLDHCLVRPRSRAAAAGEYRRYDYRRMAEAMMAKPLPDHPWFRCVFPSWDNSPRRKEGATVFTGATPGRYRDWLAATVAQTIRRNRDGERLVFVTAWNEWGEGNHLEPDAVHGRAWLEATREALEAGTELAAGMGANTGTDGAD
ncbi:group 1 glycosyl transferase [Desulfovibrio sp. X2]|uniref:glycoside hydrolase family 99-like domain-containing protein n=1 Tax=Desulfovibrio sp. X2 TaxID=941449 RepID=UPI0003587889|nr:glycoside hydrolase family 99-like domain-containing protein [Desulfovibrio sp. X2]EPR37184.1 group 1 glycosyl transferase [Desulfovibrio sp. X2]